MRRHLSSVLLLLFLLAPVCGGASFIDVSTIQPTGFTFAGARFGQPPPATMVLLQQKPETAYARYQRTEMTTSLGGVAISPPVFNYWHDRLFRITFSLDCSPATEAEAVRTLVADLDQRYGLTLLETRYLSNRTTGIAFAKDTYVTSQGAVVIISSGQWDSGWERPRVSLNDMGAREALALTANPAFTPPRLQAPMTALQLN